MSSLRVDALTGRRVLVAPARRARPRDDEGDHLPRGPQPCPFCPGHEDLTPPETGRVPADVWQARAFPNLHPLVGGDGAGRHEVLVIGRDHHRHLGRLTGGEAQAFLALACERVAAHRPDGMSVLFVNQGRAAGATLPHPHAQLVTTPWTPPYLATEAEACAADDGCAVCRAVDDEARGEHALLDDATTVAWCPPAGSHPFEVRVAPRRHDAGWEAVTVAVADLLPRLVCALEAVHDGPTPYNVVWHAGVEGLHVHAHLWAATATWAGYEHGAGVPVVTVDPAEAAARLRAVLGSD